MAYNAHLSANHIIFPDFGAARNAGLRRNNRMGAYFNIVGDLYQVVQFYPFSNNCGLDGGTVYCGIGANFYIVMHDDLSGLRDFLIRTVFLWGKTEAIAAKYASGMQDTGFAYQGIGINFNAGIDYGIIP